MPGSDIPYSRSNWGPALSAIRQHTRAAASQWAQQVQDQMRSDAPWIDRGGEDSYTGLSARQSLFSSAAMAADQSYIDIVSRSTRASMHAWRGYAQAPVGEFLELGTSRMHARYQVIWPTMVRLLPDLRQRCAVALNNPGGAR